MIALAILLVLGTALSAGAAADDTVLVSRADGSGVAADGNSGGALAVSATGRWVAFESEADNLSADDQESVTNIFVRDIELGTTTLVTRADGLAGAAANGESANPSISPGGRYVAFQSEADNLSAQDNDAVTNVYVRDVWGGKTWLASRASGDSGAAADADSVNPSVSAYADSVAFESDATNLSGEDADGARDVFVRRRGDSLTVLASRARGPTGAPGNGPSYGAAISSNGVRVAFVSEADNLDSADNDAVANVYVRDLQDTSLFLASRGTGRSGIAADGDSTDPSLSGNGRYVSLTSRAENIAGTDTVTPAASDVYLRDLQGFSTALISRATGEAGAPGDGDSNSSSVSGSMTSDDGRFVAFVSSAENLSGDDGATFDVFVRDTAYSTTSLASRASGATGSPAGGSSLHPRISDDGRYLAFSSEADNLDGEDDDTVWNVFLRDLTSFGAPPAPPPLPEPPPCHHPPCEGGGTVDSGGAAHAGHDTGTGEAHAGGSHGTTGGEHAGHSDKKGPRQTLIAARRQDIDKLLVIAQVHERGKITVEGTVNVPGSSRVYRFKTVKRTVRAHKLNKVRLKLPGKALRAVKSALRRGKRVTARVSVTAADSSGNPAKVSKTIRLKP